MSLIYTFEKDTTEEILSILANNVKKRRLEKGLSRPALSELSKVATSTIAKYEQIHSISLESFISIANALGYANDVKALLSQPLYNTMEELEKINKNKNRKKGRIEINK